MSDQQKQRDELLASGYPYDGWWLFVYEDFVEVARQIGITLGTTRGRFSVYFSGFSSQGDGASFEGVWRPKIDAHKCVTEYAPQDEELLRIAAELTSISTRLITMEEAPDFTIRITRSGHYYHSWTMSLSNTDWVDLDEELESILLKLFRDLADWLYKQLEAEHDYLTSDEALDEMLSSAI